MEKETVEEEIANVLKLLGDKTRLSMLGLLQLKDCCVCEFVEIFKMSQPAISQHIRRIKDAGLVNEQRKGQWIIYSINREHDYFPLLQAVLNYTPSQEEKLVWLKQQGLAIRCD
ncbi:ArsR/SmtB family transcription factor [Bacillus sp. N9]